ncbi:hypothetical protein [Noviherbaspirillum denitrificans]|uniref:hypothetical protein n=1 Tax=Noviherbaspirillum denitrificans TaxID=1968433 RepID=UPI0011302FB6|nr:hypothetical protein [Noviherbaspirillum denitrificans]
MQRDLGWSEEEICSRAATELASEQSAYLGAGLSRRICDYISVHQQATFYFGDAVIAWSDVITDETFSPRVIRYKGSKIDVVFLTVQDGAPGALRSAVRFISYPNGTTDNQEVTVRPVVLISDLLKGRESGVLQRLSRYTLERSSRNSVRIVCPLGVFDTTLSGLSVVELASGVGIEDVCSLLGISPRYSVNASSASIPTYWQG